MHLPTDSELLDVAGLFATPTTRRYVHLWRSLREQLGAHYTDIAKAEAAMLEGLC